MLSGTPESSGSFDLRGWMLMVGAVLYARNSQLLLHKVHISYISWFLWKYNVSLIHPFCLPDFC